VFGSYVREEIGLLGIYRMVSLLNWGKTKVMQGIREGKQGSPNPKFLMGWNSQI
jgi:hypothetical protein